jgi:hypothetical protein
MGRGFGPKDVGKERDGTKPNWFDSQYPINDEYPCEGIEDRETIGTLLQKLKQHLPYTFRYQVAPSDANVRLDLRAVPRTARGLLSTVVTALGSAWQATLFKSHLTLYKGKKKYAYGIPL